MWMRWFVSGHGGTGGRWSLSGACCKTTTTPGGCTSGGDAKGEHYRASDGDIIEAKKYTGPTPVVVPMAFQADPIIPDDLFQKVQRKLTRNARNA